MTYDIIIIGAGPAGLTAAIYASRSKLTTLVIEKNCSGGHVTITDRLENYPGFNEGINGFDLALKLESQAKSFGAEIIFDEVTSIEDGKVKKVMTVNALYQAKAIIVASGTRFRKMNIVGKDAFIGKGVSFCATCDAPFYKDKDVCVIGGGNSAVQEAIYLSKFAKNVTLIHRRDSFKASKILQEKLLSCKNISVVYDSIAKEIIGKDFIEKLQITNIKTNATQDIKTDGIFIFIGFMPNADFLASVRMDSNGYIITDENMNTSVKGIFACGDVREKKLRQAVTAASDGAQAAASAEHYIENI